MIYLQDSGINLSTQSGGINSMKQDMRGVTWRAVVLGILATLMMVVPAPGRADQYDERLDELFDRLRTTENPLEAQIIEVQIWRIWIDSEQDDMNALMEKGTRAMAQGHLKDAIAIFDRIVTTLPDFAEGWNKRATAHYLNEDYTASVIDIEHTLALEPRHFGAISGMGLIFLARGDDAGALRAFKEVLKINPHARGAKVRVEELRKKLKARGA
jgi:tetratricopeptide (TPR) repeat protein